MKSYYLVSIYFLVALSRKRFELLLNHQLLGYFILIHLVKEILLYNYPFASYYVDELPSKTRTPDIRTGTLSFRICRISSDCASPSDIILSTYTLYFCGSDTSMCMSLGHASAWSISTTFLSHNVRSIFPISSFILPDITCKLYFSTNTS